MAEGAALPLEELVELGLDPIPELRSPLSLPFFPILSLNPPFISFRLQFP